MFDNICRAVLNTNNMNIAINAINIIGWRILYKRVEVDQTPVLQCSRHRLDGPAARSL